jgi:hypothetical protein
MSSNLAFTDTETPHLKWRGRVPWEIAIISRRPDGRRAERVWQIRPDMATANPESLRYGRYDERFAIPEGHDAAYIDPRGVLYPRPLCTAVAEIADALDGAVIIGSNAQFDANWISELLHQHRIEPTWHYRPVCVATRAEGALAVIDPQWVAEQATKGPISSYALSRHLGVEPPAKDVAHTALGDARWHEALYDAVTGGRPVPARTEGAGA